MARYLAIRLSDLAIVLFGVSVIAFLMIRLIPGDAVEIMLGANAEVTDEQIALLRTRLGLDEPAISQYFAWIGDLFRGDLGTSLWTGVPVTQEIGGRIWVTLELSLLALLLSVVLAVPAGCAMAYFRSSAADYVIRVITIAGVTVPNFWLGALLIFLFFALFPSFPSVGWVDFSVDPLGNLARLLLPTIALAVPVLATLSRIARSAMLDSLGQDYIRTARSKGVSERAVVFKHALRNALIPFVTALGISAGYLFGGAIVVEQVFALPGLGRLMIGAIAERNYPLVQASILLVTATFVFINFLIDLAYAALDPRISLR
ncbi:MAG: ABC transporter permease [Azospirillaceae bacterium]